MQLYSLVVECDPSDENKMKIMTDALAEGQCIYPHCFSMVSELDIQDLVVGNKKQAITTVLDS